MPVGCLHACSSAPTSSGPVGDRKAPLFHLRYAPNTARSDTETRTHRTQICGFLSAMRSVPTSKTEIDPHSMREGIKRISTRAWYKLYGARRLRHLMAQRPRYSRDRATESAPVHSGTRYIPTTTAPPSPRLCCSPTLALRSAKGQVSRSMSRRGNKGNCACSWYTR